MLEGKQQKKWEPKQLKGAFTIEAVYLIPMILGIIVIILFTFFYLYDSALIEGAAYRAALRGARMYDKSSAEVQAEVQKIADELVTDSLIACEVKSHVDVSMTKVTVTYEIEVDSPVSDFLSYVITDYSFQRKVSKTSYRASGVDLIQIYQAVEHTKQKFGE